jgi:hypothetical protein
MVIKLSVELSCFDCGLKEKWSHERMLGSQSWDPLDDECPKCKRIYLTLSKLEW